MNWWLTADRLYGSGQSLWDAEGFPFAASSMMLFGMCVECLLKGLALSNGRALNEVIKRSHNLNGSAEDAGLKLSAQGTVLCDELKTFIEHFGRYPVGRGHHNMDAGQPRITGLRLTEAAKQTLDKEVIAPIMAEVLKRMNSEGAFFTYLPS